ncbi:MAG TPA: UrcA family protein [Caulobacteraceae bacterium]|nr:UrcA family protein [Caulobacteraceae bacterium]
MYLMPKTAIRLTLSAAAAASLALLVPAAPSQAQPAYEETTAGGDVTITAPRVERDPYTGAEIDTVFTTRIVSYADLDLSTGWGARTLRNRIIRAAHDACEDLAMRYVTSVDDDQDCVRGAVRRAMYQSPIGPSAFDDRYE